MEGAAASASDAISSITVHVKFTGRTVPVSVSPDAVVADLKSLLQPLTNVIPRGQKLIFKGKVLVDKTSLKSQQVTDGSKVMLIASQGLHQGDGPITKGTTRIATSQKRVDGVKQRDVSNTKSVINKSRSEMWKLTGVIALSDYNLVEVPKEVWDCGPSARVLDISNNSIREVPAKVSSLKSLNKLLLNSNDITDEGISWEDLSSLESLNALSLSQNHLTTLPPAACALHSLCQLHITNNKLTNLPDEIGLMSKLQILKAANNRISSVPSSIGNCRSLIEIDFSCNLLVQLPETIGNLQNLKILEDSLLAKALYLKNNGLKSLPSALFKMCSELTILDVHGTEITNDVLRQVEGWDEFDERRRSKHQKQLDFRVGSSGAFDEGADDDRSFK